MQRVVAARDDNRCEDHTVEKPALCVVLVDVVFLCVVLVDTPVATLFMACTYDAKNSESVISSLREITWSWRNGCDCCCMSCFYVFIIVSYHR